MKVGDVVYYTGEVKERIRSIGVVIEFPILIVAWIASGTLFLDDYARPLHSIRDLNEYETR